MSFKIGNQINKGRKPSLKTRRLLSKNSARKGKPLPPKTIEKLRRYCGDKSINWKGGSIGTLKLMVLERDDYTCRVCGLKDKEIVQVNHIEPFSENKEKQKDMTNMETLCPNCHVRKTKAWYRNKRTRKVRAGQDRNTNYFKK